MPTDLTEIPITNLNDYMAFVESQTGTRWYRGVGDSAYKLIPSLYRHPTVNVIDDLYKKEYQILKVFRQRSIPYLNANNLLNLDPDFSDLFLMQHYGVPTRLLDWTENPYIALYFALTSAKSEKKAKKYVYTSKVAVWVLEPETWNSKALGDVTRNEIISPPDEVLNGYKPSETPVSNKTEPIALFGIHNSPRIVAQRGVFTLFGVSTNAMEKTYRSTGYPQDCLIKLIIDKNDIESMMERLGRIGIKDSVVFPDLTGLSTEIKRQFGYRV